jgi:phosphoribosyl-AMP cyclohydrolase
MYLSPRPENKSELEEGNCFQPKFGPDGLIPCICQDADSGILLMFAFMNEEALLQTVRTRVAHYYSRSRQKLWKKGESSGHLQHVVEMRTDCDQDVILIRVRVDGPACHVGYPTCFYRVLDLEGEADQAIALKTEGFSKAFDPKAVYKS